MYIDNCTIIKNCQWKDKSLLWSGWSIRSLSFDSTSISVCSGEFDLSVGLPLITIPSTRCEVELPLLSLSWSSSLSDEGSIPNFTLCSKALARKDAILSDLSLSASCVLSSTGVGVVVLSVSGIFDSELIVLLLLFSFWSFEPSVWSGCFSLSLSFDSTDFLCIPTTKKKKSRDLL